jgi:hypothetical protein
VIEDLRISMEFIIIGYISPRAAEEQGEGKD